MSRTDIKTKLIGEQILAEVVQNVLPLIPQYFKPFDGKRARIQTGSSAAYKKLCSEFQRMAQNIKYDDGRTPHIFVYTSDYSAVVEVKIDIPDPRAKGGGCIHFESGFHIAKIDSGTWETPATGNFIYEFIDDYRQTLDKTCADTLKLTTNDLVQKHERIKELKNMIESVEQSVPYVFKELLNRGW